jgi:branched-chain amino acid transport system ATP-binding protein
MLLEIDDAWVSYGKGAYALRGVSLRLAAGEMVAVLGANGAGKSTLLRAVSGLLPLRKGAIRLGGVDLSTTSASRRVALGLVHVPEGRQMLSGMSVEENLRIGGYVQRHRPDWLARTADEVYQLFPILKERRSQLAGSLSGGQQQMLALGRALMADPKVLMCDEPSLGLAPLVVEEILQAIARLRDKGVPVLLVEQNARKALSVADRGIVIKRGEVTLEGSAAALRADPEVSAAYLGALAAPVNKE